jgi:hypothetical protein
MQNPARRSFWLLAGAGLAVCLARSDIANAAQKTVSWSDELCNNHIAFDPSRVDEQRLKNTVHLLFGQADFAAPGVSAPVAPQAITRLNLDGTVKQCNDALDRAAHLQFLPLNGVEEYRQASIAEIKDTCAYDTAYIRGLMDASALREYQPAAACSGFIDALEGKKDLLATYRETLALHCGRNASPGQCLQRGYDDLNKPDGTERARLYLTTFGWSNCAVKYNIRNAQSRELTEMRDGLEKEFRRTFKVVQTQCDSPPDAHPEFGEMAVFDADIGPATSSAKWNIVAAGLFCGSNKLYPGRIVLYIYGIGADRLRDARPITASFDVDGKPIPLTFRPYDDVALVAVEADFVRTLLSARTAAIRINDYNSPDPDRLKLDDADNKIRSALQKCYKF